MTQGIFMNSVTGYDLQAIRRQNHCTETCIQLQRGSRPDDMWQLHLCVVTHTRLNHVSHVISVDVRDACQLRPARAILKAAPRLLTTIQERSCL